MGLQLLGLHTTQNPHRTSAKPDKTIRQQKLAIATLVIISYQSVISIEDQLIAIRPNNNMHPACNNDNTGKNGGFDW